MKRNSRLIAFLLAAMMLLSMLTGCGGGGSGSGSAGTTDDPSSSGSGTTTDTTNPGSVGLDKVENSDRTTTKDTLVIRIAADPATLDYEINMDVVANQLWAAVGNTLLTSINNEEGSRVFVTDDKYSLATSYDIDDDHLGITWHLREGVKFHNGSDFTSKDVKFSLLHCASNSRYDYIDFEHIETPDDYTVYVPLFEECAAAISTIGTMMRIHCADVVGDESDPTVFSTGFIGTGPYKITNWVNGDSVTLEAFDDYFAGAPIIKNIIFRVIPEASVAMMEMETGGVDIVDLPAWTDVQSVLDGMYDGQVKYSVTTGDMAVILGFNCSDGSACQDLRVRQAICYALDREAIQYGAYEGIARVLWSVFSEGFDNVKSFEGNWPYPRDVEKAKELLAEAGYADGLDLTIIHNNDANRILACEIMGNQLAEVGINLTVKGFDTATYSAMMSSEKDTWDMWLRNWGGTGAFGMMITNTTLVNNQTSLDDPVFKEIYDLAHDSYYNLDTESRWELEDQIQDVWLTEYLYNYPMFQTINYLLYADNLQNVERIGYSWRFLDAFFF